MLPKYAGKSLIEKLEDAVREAQDALAEATRNEKPVRYKTGYMDGLQDALTLFTTGRINNEGN